MTDVSAAAGPDLVGGRLSLDFVNSEGGERNGPPEWIDDYGSLLAWWEHAGVLDAAARRALEAAGAERPAEARDVARRAIALREALYRVFVAALDGDDPGRDDLARVDAELRSALAHLRLVPDPEGWRLAFDDEASLERGLWPIARDAADLLSSDELDRVKECSGRDCSWLFLDESRNRSRRWCDMAVCGNRAKVRRHYERTKDA